MLTCEGGRHVSILLEMRRSPLQPGEAILALGALAQEHRLALFKLLVRAGAEGLPAGAIAAELDIPNSSLSFHLAQLNRAGLIKIGRASCRESVCQYG